MLSAKDNEALTRVGRGTPMGELMRRYWQPIAAVAELDEQPDAAGAAAGRGPGALQGRERHLRPARSPLPASPRRSLLRHGGGVRAALQLPRLAVRRRRPVPRAAVRGRRASRRHASGTRSAITAYPVEAKAGLLWAYLGPAPAPLVPDWDLFGDQGYKQIVFSEVPCNWFQGQENSIDPVHFEWLHSNWTAAQRGERRPGAAPPQDRLRRVRVGLRLPPRARGLDRAGRSVDRRPRVPLAELSLHRQVRVARAHRRRAHAARGWFNDPVPGTAAVRAGAHPVLVRAGHRSGDRALDHQPRDEPGLRRLAGAGDDRRPHAGASGRERSRRHPVSQAHARGGRDRRARRRAQGGRA